MKKLSLVFFIFCNFFFLFSFSPADITHHSLRNGLEIYFLQDTSTPTIRTELSIDAGLSQQTEKNAGYFDFYAQLCGAQINQDDVKIVKISSPEEFEKNLLELSSFMRPLNQSRLSDDFLKTAISTKKSALEEYFSSPAGFINSAIDSKLFPEFPWKRSSGSIPTLFNSKSVSESRALLSEISKNYYVPSKTRLFISGNLTEQSALELTEKYFGDFYSENGAKIKNSTEKKMEAAVLDGKLAKSKKYVLYDKEFSPEMTQICLQYKDFTQNEANLLAAVWGDDGSEFKKTLLKQRNLKILGAEYIDASSAQDSISSRLIIQSLLGVVKVSPIVQADLFLSKSRETESITQDSISKAIKKKSKQNAKTYENSSQIMEKLSQFIQVCSEEDKIQAFFNQNERLGEVSAEKLAKKLEETEPYVFVFVNEDIYKKNAGEFKKAGYTVLTAKNSIWFNQEEYAKLLNTKEESPKSSVQEDILNSAERFILKNTREITSLALENEIPVVLKQNPNTKDVEISLIIAGGDLLFAQETPGLASVLAGSIAVNVQNQLDLFSRNGAVEEDSYSVKSKTISTHSIITVSLPAKSLNFAIQAMYTALIFCDVTPAAADGVTYDQRTQWRLKTGTTEFQLLCQAMRILYDGTKYPRLFEDDKDKPAEMNFTKILAAYPAVLDATRFSFAINGGFSDQGKLLLYLNKTFGTLETTADTRFFETGLPSPEIKPLEKSIALRHLFLTDIPKEKAGPMPAVLVPTKKFLDPILYCLKTPDPDSPDTALFNALLLELGEKMNQRSVQAGSTSFVKVSLPELDIPFARITVTNVEHTAACDKIYLESLNEIKEELKKQLALKNYIVIDLEKNPLLARL
ncbi:MAG: insulinase family protein [Treponema sp.]|nr:insulinase family protein [Candidatus Treponema equifaecale]